MREGGKNNITSRETRPVSHYRYYYPAINQLIKETTAAETQ